MFNKCNTPTAVKPKAYLTFPLTLDNIKMEIMKFTYFRDR